MMILYKIAFPGKDSKDSKDVEMLSFEVHKFIKAMDDYSREAVLAQAAPDRPVSPAAPIHVKQVGDRAPLRMKSPT